MKVIIKTVQGYEGTLTDIRDEDASKVIEGINYSRAKNSTSTFRCDGSEITINSVDIISIEFIY